MHEFQPVDVDARTYDEQPACGALIVAAERELAAFMRAVTELFGREEAMLSAEDWLEEVASRGCLPGPSIREWRRVTIAALARRAIQITVDLHDSVVVTNL